MYQTKGLLQDRPQTAGDAKLHVTRRQPDAQTTPRGRLEDTWKMPGGLLKGAWRKPGGCVAETRRVPGGGRGRPDGGVAKAQETPA